MTSIPGLELEFLLVEKCLHFGALPSEREPDAVGCEKAG